MLTIDSEPSGAEISLDGELLGTSPYQYTYATEHGEELVFALNAEGFRTTELTVRPQMDRGVLVADAMLFHIPMLFGDLKAPELYDMGESAVKLSLVPEAQEPGTEFLLPITAMDIPSNVISGTVGGGKLTSALREEFLSDLEQRSERCMALVRGTKGSYLNGKYVMPGSKRAKEYLFKSKVQLMPELRELTMDLTRNRSSYSGPCKASMDWHFHSGLDADSLLFSIPMTFNYQALNEDDDELIPHILTFGMQMLLGDPELPKRLSEVYRSGILAGKGEPLSVRSRNTIDFLGRDDMLSELVNGVVTVKTDHGHGSGFLISNDGHIITNFHVIDGKEELEVVLSQGFKLPVTLIKENRDWDLAVLKIEASDLKCLELGNDADVNLGQEVFAIGTPLDQMFGQSISKGILSGKRTMEEKQFLQTDVSINPGNSGGPLIDSNGKVIGITTMKISGRGLEGLGFAVPISIALDMLNITIVE